MLLHGDDFPVRLGLARGDVNEHRVGAPEKAIEGLHGPRAYRLPSGWGPLGSKLEESTSAHHFDGSLWMLCGLSREAEP